MVVGRATPYGVHDVLDEVVVEVGHYFWVILHSSLASSDGIARGLWYTTLVLRSFSLYQIVWFSICLTDSTRDISTLPVEIKSFDLLSICLCLRLGNAFSWNLGALQFLVTYVWDLISAKGNCVMVRWAFNFLIFTVGKVSSQVQLRGLPRQTGLPVLEVAPDLRWVDAASIWWGSHWLRLLESQAASAKREALLHWICFFVRTLSLHFHYFLLSLQTRMINIPNFSDKFSIRRPK